LTSISIAIVENHSSLPYPNHEEEGVRTMCDDQQDHRQEVSQEAGGSELSRRGFLKATAGVAASSLLGRLPRPPLRSGARDTASDGTSAYSMAMHVHSSFSEESGSMQSQLFQAAANSVDVLWWTDHDQRMMGLGYRRVVHFTSLTKERPGPGQGGPWNWRAVESGPVSAWSGGGIVESPSSPQDPVAGGSLHVRARSLTTATAKYGYYANSGPANWNYRDNLTGQSLTLDVLLSSGWREGYLELLITTSFHQASHGRPAGRYSLSYRFVPGGNMPSTVAHGNDGVKRNRGAR
jgi:hypothetical protein